MGVDERQAGGHTALHLLCGSNSAYAAMYVQTGERNAETVEACFHLLREGSFSDQAGRVYSICISACVGLPGVGAGPARGIWGLATAPSPLGAAFG